jgi:hypothetical protein
VRNDSCCGASPSVRRVVYRAGEQPEFLYGLDFYNQRADRSLAGAMGAAGVREGPASRSAWIGVEEAGLQTERIGTPELVVGNHEHRQSMR